MKKIISTLIVLLLFNFITEIYSQHKPDYRNIPIRELKKPTY